jgi:23S rRNA (uridine2552-2'-O)-methyltransferase
MAARPHQRSLCQAAQKDGYRARAAYKLKEIDESLKLIQPGHTVVDLGCARRLEPVCAPRSRPGAAVGELNGIISLDLLPMEPIEGVHSSRATS